MIQLTFLLGLVLWLAGTAPLHAAFGLTTATDSYTVDTDAGLVFKIRRTDNGSSTQSAGDLMSMVYHGVEYQNTSRGSQVNSGFDFLYNGISAVNVSAQLVNTDFIRITVTAGDLTHYYMARNGFPHIYMATYFTTEPETQYLARYIVRIPANKLPNGPAPSDIRGNTGAIESGDIFGMADGTTRSKHYSNLRLKDWSHTGATGPGVGIWMVRGNHEGDSGGPFYRSLLNQCGDDQEITYIMNYGQAQTEPYRLGILHGPYTLVFNGGAAPVTPDTAWVADMGLTGHVGPAGRGGVSATAITGRDTSRPYTVGFSNSTAQYWADAAAGNGAFTRTGMLPGTYTLKIYKNEYVVHSSEVVVNAGATTALGTLAITADPGTTAPLWRIGEWDGSPGEFLNGDKVTTMHPSDTRMASWTPGTYVVGSSSPATGIPAYQWKDINGSQAIQFELGAGQLVNSTVRVGLTIAYEGARPKISLNSWTFPTNPAPSTQPDSRSLTTGSYRGNNVTYSFAVPASALVAGTNTLSIFPISGSGAAGFLSAGYSLDCIDFFQGTAQTVALPAAPANLGATASIGQVKLDWSAAAGATRYEVRRAGVSGGPYTTIASGVTATTFTDTGLTNGSTYYYVVSGTNSSGSGLPSPEATATAGGLVAFYALEGNAQDSSGNANHGTASAVTYETESGSQSGLFNGTGSHLVIPRSVEDDFTVSLWVKTTATGGTGTQWWSGKGLVDGEINGAAADWGMVLLNGRLAFGVGATDTTFSSTGAINDGQWHHVAASRKSSGGEIKLYVDGVLQTTGTGPAGARTAPPALRIGSIQTGSAGGFLSGGIDQVRLHNRVMDATEIAAFFNAGRQTPAAPAGLAAMPVDTHRIDLSWSAPATATRYTVQRSINSGGPFATVASGLTATTFNDTGLSQGTTYYYAVRAENENGEGNAAVASATTPQPPPARAHLRFDEGTGITAADSTGNGWTGTLVNGPLWTSGRINRAVDHDGTNDHLSLPAGVVNGLTDFTIATWVKVDTLGNWARLFDFGTGTTNYLFFTPKSSFGPARFAIRTPTVAEQVIEAPALAAGSWTHVAVTMSGATGTIYINGSPAGTNPAMTINPSWLGNTTANHIGRSQFANDPFLDGAVDDFQIHARALSAAEIGALANPPAAPAGLVATPGNARVFLSWDPVAGADGYRVRRSTTAGGPYTTIAAQVPGTSFTDTTVANGTAYHYVVTTISSVAESANSAEANATPTTPPPALVHLRFDEAGGTTAADSSGNGWNSTLLNGPAFSSGRINHAVELDGADDHATLPAGVVSTLGDFTIAAWVKWNGGNDWQRVFDFGSDPTSYLFFTPRTVFGGSRFAIRTPAVPEQIIDGPALATGVWTHVAVTLSGGTGTLYINGAPAGSNAAMTLTPSSLGSTPANYLGKSQFAADANLNGMLDEFQIHARALTPAEITALAAPPSAPGGLAATPGDSQVALSWNPAAGASGYQLKRATASGGPYTPLAGPLSDRYFTDTAVTNGTTYHYVVTALAGIAESPDSPGIASTPLSPAQAWRQIHFGTIDDTGDAADSADPDGDNTNNETERRLGLDPKDGSSAFRLSGSVVPGGFQITWPSAPGLTFRIHRGTDLDFSGIPIGTVTGIGTFTDPAPPLERAFYRIELMP